MKIENRLYISAGISIALVIILSSLVFVTSGRIAEENEKHALLNDVRTGISELDIVTYEYLLHHEKRMEEQWNSKYKSLGGILEEAEEVELPESMRADYTSLGDLFSQVTANNERIQKLVQEGASQQEIDMAIGLEERLVAQLLITSHSLIADASRLAEEAHTKVTEVQRRTARFALIFMIILAITVPTLLFRVARSISRPLDELTKGARIIGKGALEHRVEVKSKDELGELAAAFNQMAENLSQDITKRKRAEEKLRESEEKYRSLVLNIPDVAFTSDENYRIVFISPNVERLTGYTQEEEYQCGDWIKWFDRVHPDDIEHAKTAFKELFQEGKLYDIEYRCRRKDGQWIWISDRSVGTYKKEGKLYASGLFSDITERKRMEEELRKHRKHLEELVEERTAELKDAQERLLAAERLATLGQFSGSISHELRNPLSVIDSSAYYLKTKLKDADEKVLEHLNRIKSSVGSASAIIESLLNLTQMREPKLTMVDLIAITHDAIVTSTVPDTVKVIQDFPEQEVSVNADGEQLRMAFKNIVTNAVEVMDGKGTLTVTINPTADGQAEVSFADTGPGIAAKNLDKIFQPLFSTKARGIGFGLSIAKMVIDKHGGTIETKSEPGKGATITIQLPQYPDKDREVK